MNTTDPKPSEGIDVDACHHMAKILHCDAQDAEESRDYTKAKFLRDVAHVIATRPDSDRESLLAQLAAKDEAIRIFVAKPVQHLGDGSNFRFGIEVSPADFRKALAALSPDSGNEVPERLRKAERERDALKLVLERIKGMRSKLSKDDIESYQCSGNFGDSETAGDAISANYYAQIAEEALEKLK